jgi:hypothetical protein
MTYSISISGHGTPSDTVKGAFETAVRTIRSAAEEGTSGPGGSCSANDPDGTSVYVQASDVPDEPVAD